MNNHSLRFDQEALHDNTPQPQLLQPSCQVQPQQHFIVGNPSGQIVNVGVQPANSVGVPSILAHDPSQFALQTNFGQIQQFQPLGSVHAPATMMAPQTPIMTAAPSTQIIQAQQVPPPNNPQVQVQVQQQVQPQQLQVQQIPIQATNEALLRSIMDQKAQLARYESQLRQRLLNSNQSEPLLQSQLFNDPRLLMGNNLSFLNQSPMLLPSPHELTLRDETRRMRGGVIEPFPEKLHRLLLEVEATGRANVISFVANGKAFAIHKPDNFFREIVPKYFRQSRLSSFKRQLNLYGFELINTGPARGGYFHELFVKDQPELCRRMRRIAVKLHAKQQEIEKQKNEKKEASVFEATISNDGPTQSIAPGA
eukprot:CAMPEP_0202454384 /NCGR_PEP_ID=MMETSP1360-20130828/12135_1 /ASSEMBLY_ACC=CAM_ASM_000848 /TAXON_ID=515479 /ORGANISM="Licmophora paradoxa, Strain CCMP2313" /LENGTH=365 /DNA_ID=CAMNT_0049073689 /DNA_START=1986 /DNA_END=3083 /DNA_ORIENTATION=+